MIELQLANKLFINVRSFEGYDLNIVHHLLSETSGYIDRLSGVNDKATCHIIKSPYSYPLCLKGVDGHHIIFLSADGNYWCKWVYQFAHEYLHHIIGGTLSGELNGLIWFEETLCELSSIYQLGILWGICLRSQIPSLQHFAPAVLDYQHDLLVSHLDLKRQFQSPGVVSQWLPLLSEPRYHRDYYNAIACHILPLFQENPHLWRMTAYMGDSRQYQTLGDLWEHLRRCAEDSWRDSLEKLILSLS